MIIWIFNHYAGPPSIIPATRPHDLAKRLIIKGHKVVLIASTFDHYSFSVIQKPHTSFDSPLRLEGADYVWLNTTAYSKNGASRFIGMLVYACRAVFHAAMSKDKPDIVIGTCVHPFAVTAALIIAKVKSARFVYEITDLWPESLSELYGYGRWHPVIMLFGLMQFVHLKFAKMVIGLLPDLERYLLQRGIKDVPFVWIPNGIDLKRFEHVLSYSGGTSDILNLMYIGGFAKAHNLDLILETWMLLPEEVQNRIVLHFVGDGPERQRIEERASAVLGNRVVFHGFVKKDELYRYINLADAFVCTSLPLNVYRYGAFFLKVFDYLAAGRPVLFGVDASNNPVAESGGGIVFPAGDAMAFASAIQRIVQMSPQERAEMGRRGRSYVAENFDFDRLTDKFENKVISV